MSFSFQSNRFLFLNQTRSISIECNKSQRFNAFVVNVEVCECFWVCLRVRESERERLEREKEKEKERAKECERESKREIESE